MNKVRLIITSIISIVLVSILFLGTTYSIFTTTEIDEELNVYKTGDLNIKYSSNNVKITDVTPMTIEEADGVEPHRITVTNSGNVPYQFDVILTDTTSSETNTIDYQYIMTKVGYLEPKKLSNCTNNIIKEDVIILPGEIVDIDIRVWLSDNLSNSEIGKSFYAKLQVDGQAIYNDNEKIDNSVLSLKLMDVSTYKFRNSEYSKNIKNVYIVDYIDTTSASINSTSEKIIWDMSTSQDKSILAWLEDNETDDYYNLYIGSEYKIYAKNLNGFFLWMSAIESISLANLDTSLTTNMGVMFRGLNNLKSLDLSNFDTSNVTSMNYMFQECKMLTELDLSNFDTSKVTNMQVMFDICQSLTSLDLSNFDTSNVTNMSGMFGNCRNLANLDISNFNTSKVTDMSYMFQLCTSLKTINLSSFDTSSVTDMNNMFKNSSLTSLDLSNFNTGNVTDMNSMFLWCGSLVNLDVSNFDTSKVTNMAQMFRDLGNLVSLDVSSFDTIKVTNMGCMFQGCRILTELDVSNFDTSSVTNMSNTFDICQKLISLDLSNFDTSKVTNMYSMFGDCNNLIDLNIDNFDTSNVTNMSLMFKNCYKLNTTLTIRNASTTYENMFSNAFTTKNSEGIYISQLILNYTSVTSDLVDSMINSKSDNSNVLKGQVV